MAGWAQLELTGQLFGNFIKRRGLDAVDRGHSLAFPQIIFTPERISYAVMVIRYYELLLQCGPAGLEVSFSAGHLDVWGWPWISTPPSGPSGCAAIPETVPTLCL